MAKKLIRSGSAIKSADQPKGKKSEKIVENNILDASGKMEASKSITRRATPSRRPLFSAELEEALRVSNERFDQFASDTPIWIWQTDANGILTYSNQFIERLTGYQSSSVISKERLVDVLNPKIDSDLSSLQSALTSENKFSDLFIISRNKWGEEFHVSVSGSPFFDLNGKFLGFRGAINDLTEADRVSKELTSVSEYYYNILESTTDIIIILDLDLTIRVANHATVAALKNAGLESDIIGLSVEKGLPFLGIDTIEVFKRVLKNCVIETADVHYRYNGLQFDGESKRIPILRAGQVVGLLLVVSDLSRRMKFEDDLKRSNDRFEGISEIIGSWIWETNAKGFFTYSNSAVKDILGYAPEEIVGHHYFYDFLDLSGGDQARNALLSCFDERSVYRHFAVPTVSKSGSAITLEMNGRPFFDAANNFLGYQGMSTDITEYQIYEENLKKFELAVENASDLIIITDLDGVILYANKAASDITGYTKKEIIGSRPSLWGNKMPKEFYDNLWDTIKVKKKIFISEINNIRKDGSEYIADLRINPILDRFNRIKFFVGVERDVTRAKEIDRAKTEFVSVASHQLRTPLTIIKWYTESLASKSDNLNDKQKGYLEEIITSNDRMIGLVESLLNVSRIDMGGLLVEPKPTDFIKLIDSLLPNYALQLELKKIKLSFEHPLNIPIINLDSRLMVMVIDNLVSNSIKYTKADGQIIIALSLEDGSVLLSVKDTGCGIPKDQQFKVFDKFFRAGNAQKLDPQGNGLGLYIVKSIIDAVKGKIWFESEEGEGTTFYVELSLAGMQSKTEGRPLVG